MMLRLVLFGLLVMFAPLAHAVSEDVIINLAITSNDVTPPAVPGSVTATPISISQINVNWATSTDDQFLSGYRVFRDSAQVATTSLTTYSDTGLLSSTTYTYFIQAFDAALNISSSSASVSTSTLAPVATTSTSTVTSSGTSGSRVGGDVALESFTLVPGTTTTQFAWQTNRPVRYELRWGTSASYELGVLQSPLYSTDHETFITDLEPNTRYWYQLVLVDERGRVALTREGTWFTISVVDQVAPPNVSNLDAQSDDVDAVLSWQNPTVSDFSHVRILRSHLFYPTDPQAGVIVYEGGAESWRDPGIFRRYEDVFYTVFSYDQVGNVSSGAIVRLTPEGVSLPTETPEEPTQTLPIQIADIVATQDNVVVPRVDTTFSIQADQSTLISIPSAAFPPHLKTITITLIAQSDGQAQSFMLRINEAGTAYEAVLPALYLSGEYTFILAIYDFTTQLESTITGTILVIPGAVTEVSEAGRGWQYQPLALGLPLFICLLFWPWLWLLFRRYRFWS